MTSLEAGLYDLAKLFLVPVLVLIVAALAYAFAVLGGFAVEAVQRARGQYRSPLLSYAGDASMRGDDLELVVMRRLEWLRIVSRSAPMLGLVATMIPMGPALLALSNNDAKAVGANLVVAFSSVILALVAAAITHLVLTIRRRWLLEDLRNVERSREAAR